MSSTQIQPKGIETWNHKAKEMIDKRRADSDNKVDGKVFQKNVVFRNQLTPTFDDTEFTVVETKASGQEANQKYRTPDESFRNCHQR